MPKAKLEIQHQNLTDLIKLYDRVAQVEFNQRRNEAYMLASYILGVGRTQLIADPSRRVRPKEARAFASAVERRLQGEPLAYILGEWGFYEHSFKVSPDVLIPRPETESIVDWVLDNLPASRPLRVLEIGCGSGAISLSIAAQRPYWHITATDISRKALEIAKANAKYIAGANIKTEGAASNDNDLATYTAYISSNINSNINVNISTKRSTGSINSIDANSSDIRTNSSKTKADSTSALSFAINTIDLDNTKSNGKNIGFSNVKFLVSDMFCRLERKQGFDLIIANLPYVAKADMLKLPELRDEPRIALTGEPGMSGMSSGADNTDGLVLINRLYKEAAPHLKAGGRIIVEHGKGQHLAVRRLASSFNYVNLHAVKDLGGNERGLVARYGTRKHLPIGIDI